jgi:hypothetical protein
MKRNYLLIVLLGMGLGLSGCGNNTIDGFKETNNSVAIEKIEIGIACTTPATLSNYIELKSADKIVKDEENSSVKLFHDENNLKSVCVVQGKAHIERPIVD